MNPYRIKREIETAYNPRTSGAYIYGVQRDFEDSAAILDDYYKKRKNREYIDNDRMDFYTDALKTYEKSVSRLNDLYELGTFGEKGYTDWQAGSKEISDNIKNTYSDIDSASKYYGQYKDADEYAADYHNSPYWDKYSVMPYDKLKSTAGNMPLDPTIKADEKEWFNKFYNSEGKFDRHYNDDFNAVAYGGYSAPVDYTNSGFFTTDIDEASKRGEENRKKAESADWFDVVRDRLGEYTNRTGRVGRPTESADDLFNFRTEEQDANYKYMLSKGEKEAAQEYKDYLYNSGILKQQKAQYMAGEIDKIPKAISVPLVYPTLSLGAGITSSIEGVLSAMGVDRKETTMHSAVMANDVIAQQASDTNTALGYLYEANTTVGNMLPSIAISYATGSPIAGAAYMGVSAGGNAYAQAIEEGYDKGHARMYGLLVGASEAGLQYLLGGITKLAGGGNITSKVLSKVSKIDNVFGRIAAKYAVSTAGELVEEELQNYLEPLFRTILFDEDYSAPELEEIIETAVVTALTTGALEGSNIISTTVNEERSTRNKYSGKDAAFDYAYDKYINDGFDSVTAENKANADINAQYTKDFTNQQLNEYAQALAEEGLEINPNSKDAQRIKNRLSQGKNVSGYSINNLVETNEQALIKNDTTAIQNAVKNRLTELGETGNIDAIAEAITKKIVGEEKQTIKDKRLIKKSKFGTQVSNEIDLDNIDSEQFSSAWTENIGTERINPDYYNAPKSVSEGIQRDEVIQPNNKTDVVPITEESTQDIKTAREIENIPPVNAENNTDAVDVSLEEALRGVSAEIDSISLEAMKAEYDGNIPPQAFAKGMADGYRYGMLGIPQNAADTGYYYNQLTPMQREHAYRMGMAKAKVDADNANAEIRGKANGKKGRRKGTVKGDGVKIADLSKTFNDPQRKAYKILSKIAEATGIDIVLTNSAVKNGIYQGVQGSYNRSDDVITIDINSGLFKEMDASDLGKYTMLRTFSHEFTHFLEKWNPAEYDTFRRLVFEEIENRGESVEELIAIKTENGKLSPEMASREVVAEAMTDILPDSNFAEQLYEAEPTLFEKLVEKLKEFVAEIKAYFKGITSDATREAKALKTEINGELRYLDNIVKAFDSLAQGGVTNYQNAVATDIQETKAEVKAEEATAEKVEEPKTEAAPKAESKAEKKVQPKTESKKADKTSISSLKAIINKNKTITSFPYTDTDGNQLITDGSFVINFYEADERLVPNMPLADNFKQSDYKRNKEISSNYLYKNKKMFYDLLNYGADNADGQKYYFNKPVLKNIVSQYKNNMKSVKVGDYYYDAYKLNAILQSIKNPVATAYDKTLTLTKTARVLYIKGDNAEAAILPISVISGNNDEIDKIKIYEAKLSEKDAEADFTDEMKAEEAEKAEKSKAFRASYDNSVNPNSLRAFAKKAYSARYRYANTDSEGRQYISDGNFLVRLNTSDTRLLPTDKELLYEKAEIEESKQAFEKSTEKTFAKIIKTADDKIVGEAYKIDKDFIKKYIKENKVKLKDVVLVKIGDSYFNISYVDAILKSLKNPEIYLYENGNYNAALFKGENGEGILMPIRYNEDGSRTIAYTAEESRNGDIPNVINEFDVKDEKLQDFGEKIGGARKDVWRKRGLLPDDVEAMNERERDKYVNKDNTWKRPNYTELAEEGADRGLLYAVNEIRKSLNAKLNYRNASTEEARLEKQKLYVDTIREIEKMANEAKTAEDFKKMGYEWAESKGYLEKTDRGFSYTEKWRNNPALYVSDYIQTINWINRNFDKLLKLADKKGFAVPDDRKIPNGYSIIGGPDSTGSKLVNGEWVKDTSYSIVKGRYILQSGFTTYDDALKALQKTASTIKSNKKTNFTPPQLENVHRKGPNYRQGKHAEGQDYIDTFGFRGGEFGNWLNANDRQASLDYGFDALKDLAEAIGVTDEDISFLGKLAIAFGARGKGAYAAHYEPARQVINLTKIKGAGSLAHEWFHALDDFIGGYKNKFATEHYRDLPPKTQEAVKNLVQAMNYTDMSESEVGDVITRRKDRYSNYIKNQMSYYFKFLEDFKNDKITREYIERRRYKRMPTQADVDKYNELLNDVAETGNTKKLSELSQLHKDITGHVISKSDIDKVALYANFIKLENESKNENPTETPKKPSEYYKNSVKMGEIYMKSGGYWESTIEMAARAFATYIADKTQKQNDYLSGHSEIVGTKVKPNGELETVKPFPTGEERKKINSAFDSLITALKEDGFLHQREKSNLPDNIQYQSRNYLAEQEQASDEDIQSQKRTPVLSNTDILELAAEELTADEKIELTADEKAALGMFQKQLTKVREIEAKRKEQSKLYREQNFGKNPDKAAATATKNRMDILDGQISREMNKLLSLENKDVLKNVLGKARKVIEANEKARGKTMLANYREKMNNNRNSKIYKERIIKDVENLTDRFINADNKKVEKYVPDALKKAVSDFIDSIDIKSNQLAKKGIPTGRDVKLAKKLSKLLKLAEDRAENRMPESIEELLDISPETANEIMDFIEKTKTMLEKNEGQYVINEMSVDDLKSLSSILRKLKGAITNLNKMHRNAVFEKASEAGENSVQELEQYKKNSTAGEISNALLWKTMRPALAFERFGEGGKSIFEELQEGQSRMAMLTKEFKEFVEKTYTEKDVRKWRRETHTFNFANGKAEMTLSQIMTLYMHLQQKDSLNHLYGGGFLTETFTKNGKKVVDKGRTLTEADAAEIIDFMNLKENAKLKETAEKIQQYMAVYGRDLINEVNRIRWDDTIPLNLNYIPIEVLKSGIEAKADPKAENASLYALINRSWSKARNEAANNMIVIRDMFDVFAQHMGEVAQYNSYALPVLDALKWLNYNRIDEDGQKVQNGSLREAMRTAFGQKSGESATSYAEAFVTHILKALNGTEAQGNEYDTVPMKSLHAFNRAQVAYNFRVVIQQPMSLLRAADVIDIKSIMKSVALSPKELQSNLKEMLDKNGVAVWKDLGFFGDNLSTSVKDIFTKDETAISKITDVGLKGAEFADTITWGVIWGACKNEVQKKQGISPDSEKFIPAVNKLFNEVIYKTQVVDSPLTKSEFLRSKSFAAKAFGSFMAEPLTTVNLPFNAFSQYANDIRKGMSKSEAWQKNKKQIGRTVYIYALNQTLIAAVTAAMDAARDDDDEEFSEKYIDKFKENLLEELNPLSKLPYVGDVVDAVKLLLNNLGVDTYGYEPRKIWGQWTDSLNKAAKIFSEKISGEGKSYTWYGGIHHLLRAVSGATGIPLSSATREIVTAWNNTVGAYAPSMKIKTDYFEYSNGGETVYEYYASGDKDKAVDYTSKMIDVQQKKGKNKKDAKSYVKSQMTRQLKPIYLEAQKTNDKETMKLIKSLMKDIKIYGNSEDVSDTLGRWIKQESKDKADD